jgi:hypothetical protein
MSSVLKIWNFIGSEDSYCGPALQHHVGWLAGPTKELHDVIIQETTLVSVFIHVTSSV